MYSEILKIQTLIFQLKARVRVPIMLYQVRHSAWENLVLLPRDHEENGEAYGQGTPA